MKIQLDRIPEQGLHLEVKEPPEILGLSEDPLFSASESVNCSLYMQVVEGTLIVRGTVSTTVCAHCARCSQIFSTTVTDSGFLRDYSDVSGVEEVDLTEGLREAILLNLPNAPLCSEKCKGLCVQCGKNLNEELCGCTVGDKRGVWKNLDNLNL